MDNTNTIKIIENGLVTIILFVIIIILYKPLINMIERLKIQSAQENTRNIADITKNYYMSLNLIDYVKLPFKIVFKNQEYKVYSGGLQYIPSQTKTLRIKGKLPTHGSVELKENGEVEITDLKVGNYICNKKNNLKEECIKIE